MPRRRVSGSQMFGYTRDQRVSLDVSFDPTRNQYVEAWLTYAVYGGSDPKALYEARAASLGMGAAYPMALAKATALGFFVGGTIGFIFDPMHLYDSGFDEPDAWYPNWIENAPMSPPGWG